MAGLKRRIHTDSDVHALNKELDDVSCPICMDHPHNAVLLLCTSHVKGCRSYICDTSYRHSNCLDRYKKLRDNNGTCPPPTPPLSNSFPINPIVSSSISPTDVTLRTDLTDSENQNRIERNTATALFGWPITPREAVIQSSNGRLDPGDGIFGRVNHEMTLRTAMTDNENQNTNERNGATSSFGWPITPTETDNEIQSTNERYTAPSSFGWPITPTETDIPSSNGRLEGANRGRLEGANHGWPIMPTETDIQSSNGRFEGVNHGWPITPTETDIQSSNGRLEGVNHGSLRNSNQVEELEIGNTSGSNLNLKCPMCRGSVLGWEVVEDVRKYLNLKKRSCSQETCSFFGNYLELRRHARRVHPTTRPSDSDPSRERAWRRLERQREVGDIVSAIRSAMPGAVVVGDYVLENGDRSGGEIGAAEVNAPWWATFFLFQMIGSMDDVSDPRRPQSRTWTRHRRSIGTSSNRRFLWGENLLGLQDDEEDDDDDEDSFPIPRRRRRRLTRPSSDEDHP